MKRILTFLTALLLAPLAAMHAADSPSLQPPQHLGKPKPEQAVNPLPTQPRQDPVSYQSEWMFEATFESEKAYSDPFNDVDVDVVFTKDGRSWRVPTFWRGGKKWSVRFAPPLPGEYRYRLVSTDHSNPDLNGHEGRVAIAAYTGSNELLRHGKLRVSQNQRYFEC